MSDAGDLTVRQHRPAPRVDGVRALEDVRAVCKGVADAVADIVAGDAVPIVLGGNSRITLEVIAGLRRTGPVGQLYFDGDVDLNTPELSGSGVLDTMGVTHLLGGGVAALADQGGVRPLLDPQNISLFKFDPAKLDENLRR